MINQIATEAEDAAFARTALLQWFGHSARQFPWRYDTNPYHVLIAEMMLRRTQARQVAPVYKEFLRKFPDVRSLHLAANDDVRATLYPLGLKWRAENFKALANELTVRFQGELPHTRRELLSLPGIGPYVADAIRCFAYGETVTLADTNTVRVAARYFGFDYNAESRRKPQVVDAVTQLIEPESPVSANYALLDFAAQICRAASPLCSQCPLASRCNYFCVRQA